MSDVDLGEALGIAARARADDRGRAFRQRLSARPFPGGDAEVFRQVQSAFKEASAGSPAAALRATGRGHGDVFSPWAWSGRRGEQGHLV